MVADTLEPSEQQALSERLWNDRNNCEQGDYYNKTFDERLEKP